MGCHRGTLLRFSAAGASQAMIDQMPLMDPSQHMARVHKLWLFVCGASLSFNFVVTCEEYSSINAAAEKETSCAVCLSDFMDEDHFRIVGVVSRSHTQLAFAFHGAAVDA
eukprot:5311836-Amphidinium_carterae.2